MRFHRLINSKYPTIDIFDDISSHEDFEAIYAMQAKSNPRLRLLNGRAGGIDLSEIPLGDHQVHAAIAPFVHIPITPSRFSAGGYGVLYGASTVTCGLKEVSHHIQKHMNTVKGIAFDNIQLREYVFDYSSPMVDVRGNADYHDPDSYAQPQAFGAMFLQQVRDCVKAGLTSSDELALHYNSVRSDGDTCIALFSPRFITRMSQSRHYSMMYNAQSGTLSRPNRITNVT
tara:strand:- start:22093 stop:22779 length:687 start_codon:yes stop_codon:yes gene_type:complete